jgi:hypothetical protein
MSIFAPGDITLRGVHKKAGHLKLHWPQFQWRRDLTMLKSSANSLVFEILTLAAAFFLICHNQLNAQTTPQMNIESRFWVRVLLDDNLEK